MSDHPYGWLSLAPPLAAIVLAIATRRILLSLLAGVFLGSLVMARGDAWLAIDQMLEAHLWRTFVDEGKLRVFSFTLLMGAMVGVINRSGGMRGLVIVVTPWARTPRRGQLTVWILGLLIFFDDYANTLLLGSTLRPLCDRLKISRAKLAYLVDSTAAPVAGLALISTWIAVEIEYLQDGLNNLAVPMAVEPFELFVASIPYRFYVLLALLFVPMIAILGRDFGPMLSAERARLDFAGNGDNGETFTGLSDPTEPDPETPARWYNAILPIAITLAVVIFVTYTTGKRACLDADPTSTPALRSIMGNGDSSFALQRGALAGLLFAGGLAMIQRLLSSRQVVEAAATGARLVIPAIAILWFASTISRMTGNKSVDGEPSLRPYEHADERLYTGDYLQGLLLGEVATGDADAEQVAARSKTLRRWLPTTAFVLASAVAFSTGTSFGTMGILLPMIVPLAAAVLAAEGGSCQPFDPIFLCSVGGILAGAIFGDHCSPISDTTVLSSQASGCDHMLHVWTQMPYALTVGAASIVLGTIPIGFGVPVWLLLPVQLVALFVLLLSFGKIPEAENS